MDIAAAEPSSPLEPWPDTVEWQPVSRDLVWVELIRWGASAAMLKGDLDYNPAVAKSAIMTLRAVSHSYGSFFPEGSDKGDTKASPKIWSDNAGFEAELAKFQADADAAAKAAGKDGPADLDAFKAAVTPVFSHCKTCHQDYRLK